jgi:hypothetical protein
LAGAVVAIAFWLGLIVIALNNLDTGLPDTEGMPGWLFWLIGLGIVAGVALYLRRSGGPGWGAFLAGVLFPEVAYLVNRLVTTEISVLFWILVAALVVIPLPGSSTGRIARGRWSESE